MQVAINKHINGGGRHLGLDLLRIVAMAMVLVLHLNLLGGFLAVRDGSWFEYLVRLVQHTSAVAVDVFVIISAWFLCRRKATLRRLFSLLATILTYTVLTTLIALALGMHFSLRDLYLLLPIVGNNYDFCNGYIVMYLLSPFLNRMLDSLTPRLHALLAIGLLVLFSLLSPVMLCGYLGLRGGYHFVWFCILYVATSWLRTLNLDRLRRRTLAVLFCAAVLIGTLADVWRVPMLGSMTYNHPLVAFCAFTLVLLFAKTEVHNAKVQQAVVYLAPASFAVFLLHASHPIEAYYASFHAVRWFVNAPWLYLIALPLAVAVVYMFCTLVEKGRVWLFRTAGIDAWVARLADCTDAADPEPFRCRRV